MSSPVRFLTWVLGVIFTLGLADSFGRLTFRMAQAAVHAHAHDQISYSTYTSFLWGQRPAKRGKFQKKKL
jgi:hypothetical protein